MRIELRKIWLKEKLYWKAQLLQIGYMHRKEVIEIIIKLTSWQNMFLQHNIPNQGCKYWLA